MVEERDMSPIIPSAHSSKSTRSSSKTPRTSHTSIKEGRGKKLGEIVSSFCRHETSGSSSSGSRAREEEREMRIVSTVLGGGSGDDLFSSGSERMDQDLSEVGLGLAKVEKDDDLDLDDEAWETRSPARRLFVGYDRAGSPSLK